MWPLKTKTDTPLPMPAPLPQPVPEPCNEYVIRPKADMTASELATLIIDIGLLSGNINIIASMQEEVEKRLGPGVMRHLVLVKPASDKS